MLKHVLLAEQPVLTAGQSVVGREENVRVVFLSGLLELSQDAANLRVHVSDDRVILLAIDLHRMLGARERGEAFVSQIPAAFHLLVVRVLGDEVLRNGDLVERVAINEFFRRLPRVVRSVKGDVHEEGVVGFLCHPEIIDGVIADDFAPVFSAFPEAAELHVERAPLVGLSFDRPVVARFRLFRHSATNMSSDCKCLRRVSSDVPLSCEEGFVAG